jgi:drug/metabolite transporter (DMT)-like permease
VLAALGQTSFQVLFLQGLHATTASVSAILLASAPLLTAAWLGATGRERLVRAQWLGLILGLAGVALVVSAGGLSVGTSLIGNLLALGAAVAWAWYGLTIGSLTASIGPVRASGATVGIAAMVLAPFGLGEAASVNWADISLTAWAGLLYGATFGLALATVLWVRSVQRWGTQATMNYGYVEPVAAVLIAAIALHEVLLPIQAVGAVLALIGVYLASTPPTVTPEELPAAEMR